MKEILNPVDSLLETWKN